MKSLLASVRHDGRLDRVDQAVRLFEEEWSHGEPILEDFWADHDPDRTTSVLASLVKVDVRCRFARGERPEINDYLARLPELRAESEWVLSLVYEEFCLREEHGEKPDVDSFCRRYSPWRDSLVSQLKYHDLLSRVVGPSPTPPRFPEPGEYFQEFAIDSVLGQGGTARVYRARDTSLEDNEVVLKVSHNRGREPAIMARLDHEHIIPVKAVVIQEETRLRGLSMPYRPGLPLDEVIRRVDPSSRPCGARVFWEVVEAMAPTDSPPPPDRAGWGTFPMQGTYSQGVAWIIAAMARAVAYAHSKKVEHRDIKPANVLLTVQNGPQLFDFNLAHDPHAAEQAEAALRGGTLPYMAPEQLVAFIDPACWQDVGAGADLYALGLLMHELLTGQAPRPPDQALPLPRAIRSLLDHRADLRFEPRRFNPAIPHALEAITIKCLAYSEADRYPNAQALVDDLRLFLDRRPLRHAANPSIPERFGNWSRRNLPLLALIAVLGVAGFYRGLQRLYPVERRSTFQAAISAIDEGETGKATMLLESLLEEYPDSILLRFYLAVAACQERDFDRAATHFAKALQDPEAVSVLVAWGQERPRVLDHLEALGIGLNAGYRDLSRESLRMAISLGSMNVEVFKNAAKLDEEDKKYDVARDGWTTAIRLIEARTPLPHRHRIELYQCRARTLILWGVDLQADGSPGALNEASERDREALVDLDRVDAEINASNDPEKFKLKFDQDILRGEVELGLCDLAIKSDRREGAHEHFRKAKKVISGVEGQLQNDQRLRNGKEYFERLNKKLNEQRRQLAADTHVPPIATH